MAIPRRAKDPKDTWGAAHVAALFASYAFILLLLVWFIR